MTLWENVWEQVRKEMPESASRPRSWGGFFGALVAAAIVVIIWFPVRLIAEILKALPTGRKTDHRPESEALFRDAYERAAALPSPTAFAESVLRHTDLSPALHDAFEVALRKLYADNMMLAVPPIPLALDGLDAIRWRDRLRQEIPRMNESALVAMRRASLESVEAATALLPKLSGDGDLTAPNRIADIARTICRSIDPAVNFRELSSLHAALSGECRNLVRRTAQHRRKIPQISRTPPVRRSFAVSRRHSVRRYLVGGPSNCVSSEFEDVAPLDRRGHRRGQDHSLAISDR